MFQKSDLKQFEITVSIQNMCIYKINYYKIRSTLYFVLLHAACNTLLQIMQQKLFVFLRNLKISC